MTLLIEAAAYLGSVAAGVTSLGIIWRKGVVPFRRMVHKIGVIHHNVSQVSEFQDEARQFMSDVRSDLELIKKHVDDSSIHVDSKR